MASLACRTGIEFTVLNPRNYGADFYSDILFSTENELKQHPERVKAFRQASLEGWYYAMNHPHEIINLLLFIRSSRTYFIEF